MICSMNTFLWPEIRKVETEFSFVITFYPDRSHRKILSSSGIKEYNQEQYKFRKQEQKKKKNVLQP